jgi:hypothetical protein
VVAEFTGCGLARALVSARAPRASPARNKPVDPGLGRHPSPWVGRHDTNSGSVGLGPACC